MSRLIPSRVALLVVALSWTAVAIPLNLAAQQKGGANEEVSQDSRSVQLTALEEFNSLIGGWRGVAQPQRGSNKGAWSETAEWVWEVSKTSAAVRYTVKEGKQLVSGRFTYDPEKEQFTLDGVFDDKSERRYVGRFAGNKLTLDTEPDESGATHQMVVTRLNEKRTLVLYQTRLANQKQFARVAEVGYTREGTKLAEEGVDGPECVVTGGKGTTKLEYKGKTYWVCCTGCRDAFLDDPEGIIADAAERAKKKAAKKPKS